MKRSSQGFKARVYFLRPEEGGRTNSVTSGYGPMLHFGLRKKGRKLYNDGVVFLDEAREVQPEKPAKSASFLSTPSSLIGTLRRTWRSRLAKAAG
jgi:hypothetical protein